MAQRSGTTGAELVGREPELETLREFLGSASAPRMLVLHGPPGMGKTTLWEAGCALAAESGYRVLRARASDTEVELAYSSVADLLETVTSAELQTSASPSTAGASGRAPRIDPTDEAPDARTVGTGLTAILRHLSKGERPVLVSVDDVQWLDRDLLSRAELRGAASHAGSRHVPAHEAFRLRRRRWSKKPASHTRRSRSRR